MNANISNDIRHKLMNNFKYYNVNINLIIHDLQLLRTSISWFNVPTYKPNAHHRKILQLRDRCLSKMRDAVWIFSYSGVVWVHDPQPHLDHGICTVSLQGRFGEADAFWKDSKCMGETYIHWLYNCIFSRFGKSTSSGLWQLTAITSVKVWYRLSLSL